MRWTYYAGWVNVILGVVLGIGFVPLGLAPVGGILLVTLVGSGAFMIWLASGWDKPLEDAMELHKYGRPANARVLAVDEERLNADGGRTARVQLHVSPVNESDYSTTRTLLLPGGRVPAVGETVTVKFDPQNRKNVVLLEESFVVESPTAAAMRQVSGMRTWTGTALVTMLAGLALAAPAGAARTEVVRMPAHTPELVSGGAVFFSPSGGDLRVVRALPGQPAQTLTTLDRAPGGSEFATVFDRFRLAASDSHVAASRHVAVNAKGAEAENSFFIQAGPAAGPLTTVHQCRDDHPIDVEDQRLAHTNGCTEQGGVPPVLVRNLNTPTAQVTQVNNPPARVIELDLAGFHIAMLSAPGGKRQIAVQEPGQPNPFYTVPADNVIDFSVQADGKLAVKEQTEVSCRIVWYSKTEPTPHNIEVCPEGDIVLAGDQIALTRETDSLGSLDIVPLTGVSQRVATLTLASTVGYDFDGSRVVYAISGCVPRRDAVYLDDLAGGPTDSTSPKCAAKISRSAVRASSKGIVRVGFSCKEGCQGGFRLTRGGKSVASFKQLLQNPGSGKVSLRLTSATRKLLADRGSLNVRAEFQVGQNDGVPRDYRRTIKLLEPK